MSDLNQKKIVGEQFEDMSIAEMAMVQGSGDVEVESSYLCSAILVSKVVTAAVGSFASGVQIVKTVKGNC